MTDEEENKEQIQQSSVLQSVFGRGAMGVGETSYFHPLELELLTKTMEIMQKTQIGRHLLGVVDAKKVGIRVIKNRNAHGYSPDLKKIFLGLPPEMTEPDAHTVLELTAAIREVEQEIVGFRVPDEKSDPLGAAAAKHAKYLDIIVHMCKMAHELTEIDGSTEYVAAIERLGHGDILKAHLAEVSNDEIYNVYKDVNEKVSQA